jgi:large conductance mechanosensitive channel
MRKILNEFKEFAVKGNAVDLAVGVIIGAAFGAIVNSLVKDVIMPPISLLIGGLDFSNKFIILRAAKGGATAFNTPTDAAKAGAITWNYGNFITLVINFLIVAAAIFLVIRIINQLRHPAEKAADTKDCPVCAMKIPIKATRCPYCTIELSEVAPH